ncbi:Thiamine-binding periplasmic protein precursor [Aquimixticola soesokkakensis]|uniref:Thiamine-binding periplasmic protein n=1 Tax=Aquimixticola soesokkakensis TaxID=1519096 RepID=A0A1Y5R766_9RHOB|nr:thiamine ABC transporter substrate binding subunit [Aquimixticola soesokkakensis]SLN10010.1 Thiamine-binding periplasmic protein precursor [Aquimixticola soesokkakensis]
MKTTLTLSAVLWSTATLASAETLTVYAPDYFGSEWGPGPAIAAAFGELCDGCELEYVTGDLLPRLKLEGARTDADVAIGFNTDVMKDARETGLFAPSNVDLSGLTLPIAWDDDIFVPFNWGYTAFVYDNTKIANPPTSFKALVESDEDWNIAIQDPRTSASGLALILWAEAVFGEDTPAMWAQFAPKIITVTQGWSEAYGLFTDGEVDMVLSYTTSPAYHIIAEEDDTKSAALFSEGHYFMAETAAQLASTDQPELAQKFMDFILSEPFQSLIATANWSYPAALPMDQWPEAFSQLNYPETALFYSEDEAAALKDEALDAWLSAFTQ